MRNRERGFQFDSDPRQDRIQQMKQENLYKFRRNRKIFWIKSAGEHSWLSSGASLVSEYFTLLRNITNGIDNDNCCHVFSPLWYITANAAKSFPRLWICSQKIITFSYVAKRSSRLCRFDLLPPTLMFVFSRL